MYGKYLKQPRSKTKTKEEKDHHQKVASLPCIMCGHLQVELHHIREFTGTGRKESHMDVLPLCFDCHRGDLGFHGLGRKAWEKMYNITQKELLERVNKLIK